MTYFRNILFSTALLLLFVLPTLAQDDGEDTTTPPVVPYFNAENPRTLFNVPIPFGWADMSEANQAHFVNGDLQAEIYTLVLDAAEISEATKQTIDALAPDQFGLQGIQTVVEQIAAETPTLRFWSLVTLSNGDWTEAIYQLADGTDVTAFAQVREQAIYVLAYFNRAPGDFLMLIKQPEKNAQGRYEPQDGIAAAMTDVFFGETLTPETTDTVALSNGDWQYNLYPPLNDLPLAAIGQARGDAVYVVIENGDEDLINTANKVFFTVFFGWFVTPYNDPYLYLALSAVAIIMIALIASIILRYRNLRKDLALIERLKQEA